MGHPSRIGRRAAAWVAAALIVIGALAPGARAGRPHAAATPPSVVVSGNHLAATPGGPAIRLLGVNRSGSEYMCLNRRAGSVFAGPTDAASIAAIRAWHANAVRLPLNEDCWLGINGTAPALSGTAYQHAIESYVRALGAAGFYVILDLHWTAPGSILAGEEWPMPDADHAPAFWRGVAKAFRGQRNVIFDLFNEPFTSSWACWRNGCQVSFTDSAHQDVSYRAAGMQTLVDAVRSTGARTPLMLGGIVYSTDDQYWAAYEPTDPDHQLIASFHGYNFGGCSSELCWSETLAPLAATTPLVAGEIGENGCTDSYITQFMSWADAHGVSYLGWAWDATDSGWSCSAGPALIVNYAGTPTAYGAGLRAHLAALARR